MFIDSVQTNVNQYCGMDYLESVNICKLYL